MDKFIKNVCYVVLLIIVTILALFSMDWLRSRKN